MRILAAMSGGVDSAVAAARAVEAGHDVVGVHLALSRAGGTLRTGSRGCCTIEDALDARRASDMLGIPFYVWDFSERFRDDVIEDFISEYQAGRTPNPCMRCNEKIKFAALLERAIELGFDAVCTGHYATLVEGADGLELHRASDNAKDQSYVLGVLTAEQLAHTYFPLGTTPSKAIVRAEAEARGLSVAQKPDSHDICFIPDGDTRGWLAEKVGTATGEIVDRSGDVVGSHEGAHAFTVGQRRGLKLGVPASDGKPRFVLEVRPVTNTVVVGPKEALAIAEIAGARFSWAGAAPRDSSFECHVQIRAHSEPVAAHAVVSDDGIRVTPEVPLDGVAPGQTAVLYLGTRVLGQLTIDTTVSAVPVGA
ncbi:MULTISPECIES: tRNA 2-thiouridine(34) synthase MnmA [unclassified Microbacterium]|uniref:tRNA 2-thiouridine(34) synthase MnmA n=1 Tax=unclassified Microbacterium TaxID=2609290 RepID=UPI000CFB18FB|nr:MULTISPECIES: tRNA 2-thiouridine(34) synthase MnmA [unclassified Microbacterium]PQZ61131.1 tRNA 2-thiouridine(34) synthase MnmA [Microbacterium sp. MYb43]PQZ82342.1 tRNA 2-thiouridine(34) synthase MnmA [Microbacterium sp. MYb40]PRB23958.1 tRNA 2-thiouridine(34) synthase MnmA [Microbacterium sp. MYb54]PRB30789.1 tRNA 2-thiouridine(34) synthase MnmA [Microbacterium sp. MYb50]PRB70789.1 tRNA 2-thiouridine(34) synthase MnmA [Microbacterium sp. MYb24]